MLTYRVYKDHAELEKCERFMWGELNIPSEKNGVPVTVICEGALRDRMMITGAVLPESVHTIAANSFSNSGCKKVTIYDPSCSIADNCGIKCQIAGYDGSTAQAYAQKKGLEFISMGPAPSHGPVSDLVPGDSNCDKFVDLADAVLIMQAYSNPNKYGLNGYDSAHITEKGAKNGDVDGGGNGITPKDAVAIQRYLLGVISEL
jgi:hypothetical protein